MGEVLAFRPRANSTVDRAPRPVEPTPGRRGDPLWRDVVGEVLREARVMRDETQRQVAARAGISVQYLSEIERGRKEPSSEMLAAVSGALGLPLLDLTRAVGHRLTRSSGRPAGPVALAA